MSFSAPSTIRTRSKNNVPPVGVGGREQSSSAFKHIPAEERNPSRPGNIHINLISSAADSVDRTGHHPVKLFARETLTEDIDHAQCHRGTGDQTQFTREDVNGTGWGPEFYPECEIPGSPTELNSPTRYEVYTSPLEFQATHRRSSRARTPTRKAREIKIIESSLAKVRGSSHKIQKKLLKASKPLRQVCGAKVRSVPF
jgi:hypothetical protein